MTRRRLVRNFGTVCVGTVLLGIGSRAGDSTHAGGELAFNEDEPPPLAPLARRAALPQPGFGPLAFPVDRSTPPVAAAHPKQPTPAPLKHALRTSASDVALAFAPELAAPLPAPAFGPDHTDPPSPEAGSPANEPAPGVMAAIPSLASAIAPNAPPPVAPAADLAEQSTPAENVSQPATPPVLALGEPVALPPAPLALPQAADLPAHPPAGITVAEAQASGEVPAAFAPAPPPPPQPSTHTAATPSSADLAAAPPAPARRLIPARTVSQAPAAAGTTVAAETPTAAETAGSAPPSLAAAMPSARAPIPLVTSELPPAPTPPAAANDDGLVRAAPPPAMQAPASAGSQLTMPQARTATTLGLGTRDDAALAAPGSNSPFTASAQPPQISTDDELILEAKVDGFDATDTVIAYGTRAGIYLPVGALARILDLAISVSDDGHYASGWFIDQQRTLTLDLRRNLVILSGKEAPLSPVDAVAFEGELYLRAERFADFLPLTMTPDLRSQSLTIKTTEPFPFQQRQAREAARARLAARGGQQQQERWPRREADWRLFSLPLADVELRAVSDRTLGTRGEADVRLAGDFAFMTAEAYLSGNSKDGLTASLVDIGRRDPDGDLLGPLKATEFSLGDVASYTMPLGLRSVTGRGIALTNAPLEAVSVFDKVDLRGILTDGFEVELYRNDILIGSTRDAVNGQYEFLQVPVDYGLNVFRLVFYGPQGQRREEVRRVSVGDGRLAKGQLIYRIGAVQKDENVFGVRDPRYLPTADFGRWRGSAEIDYGISSALTGVLAGGWFESATGQKWLATAGLRTSIGPFAAKGDIGTSDNGGMALSGGIGGRIGNGSFTLSHAEYRGGFIDETRSFSNTLLRRTSELDFNTSLHLGAGSAATIPVTIRARRVEFANGQRQIDASLRTSARLAGLQLSNTLQYSQSSFANAKSLSQLYGNFDLATTGTSRTRARVSLGYSVLPQPTLQTAALQVDHALDENTALQGTISYGFRDQSTHVGLSAVRDFDRFTLALDGNYGFRDRSYALALRLGFSFGRDPLRGNFFVARTGLASSGGISLRAFEDANGDGAYQPGETLLPGVDFSAFNQTASSGADGIARLSNLGNGTRVSVQLDPTTLPDISMAPVTRGIEIVPRPGRIQAEDFPVVALSEIEGTAYYAEGGQKRGVSGVRLQLIDANGKMIEFAKTEVDGYFFFEQVQPGTYEIRLDPEQSARLKLCLDEAYTALAKSEADVIKRDVVLHRCE